MCSIQHVRRSGLRGRILVHIAATAKYAAPTRVFGIFCAVLAQPYANLRTLYARPTYTYYVRNRTPVIRTLTRGYANFIRHKYAVHA